MVSVIFHWLQLFYFLTSIILANSNIYISTSNKTKPAQIWFHSKRLHTSAKMMSHSVRYTSYFIIFVDKCVNGEHLGNACLSQMCQWRTAGERMSFTNVSMANCWGTHVFHKCVNGKQLGNTCLSHRYNGEQLGNACLSQMCQWGTHVFHKWSINIYIFRWLGVVVWLWRRVTDTDHEEFC